MREARAALGEAIDVRGLVEGAAEAAEVMRSKVVGEDEDDVRFVRGDGRERSKEQGEEAHSAEEG